MHIPITIYWVYYIYCTSSFPFVLICTSFIDWTERSGGEERRLQHNRISICLPGASVQVRSCVFTFNLKQPKSVNNSWLTWRQDTSLMISPIQIQCTLLFWYVHFSIEVEALFPSLLSIVSELALEFTNWSQSSILLSSQWANITLSATRPRSLYSSCCCLLKALTFLFTNTLVMQSKVNLLFFFTNLF